jgi:hypothetical protein
VVRVCKSLIARCELVWMLSAQIVAGKTKDVFIEVTATDLTKAHIVLNTMVSHERSCVIVVTHSPRNRRPGAPVQVTMFAGYCERPCEVEQVRVTYEDGLTYLSPKLDGWYRCTFVCWACTLYLASVGALLLTAAVCRPLVARVSEINSLLGLELVRRVLLL